MAEGDFDSPENGLWGTPLVATIFCCNTYTCLCLFLTVLSSTATLSHFLLNNTPDKQLTVSCYFKSVRQITITFAITKCVCPTPRIQSQIKVVHKNFSLRKHMLVRLGSNPSENLARSVHCCWYCWHAGRLSVLRHVQNVIDNLSPTFL